MYEPGAGGFFQSVFKAKHFSNPFQASQLSDLNERLWGMEKELSTLRESENALKKSEAELKEQNELHKASANTAREELHEAKRQSIRTDARLQAALAQVQELEIEKESALALQREQVKDSLRSAI